MKTSPTIGKLTEALAKAQSAIKGALKDSDNPFFKSKYADLESVWEACRKPLTDNGLAIIQGAGDIIEGKINVETILSHISGEWISSTFSATPEKQTPQGVGSCITYLRRYGLQSIAGIAPADDDGEAAEDRDTKAKAKPEPKVKSEPKPKLEAGLLDDVVKGIEDATEWKVSRTKVQEALFLLEPHKMIPTTQKGVKICVEALSKPEYESKLKDELAWEG